MNTCKLCGRPLTAEDSILNGIGPVCGSKSHKRNADLFSPSYYWLVRRGVLAIIDLGDVGAQSVTNGIETVLKDISIELGQQIRIPVIYKDSMGRWDQVVMDDNGAFDHFHAIDARDIDAAAIKAKARGNR